MKIKTDIKINVDASRILKKRGLEPNGAAQKWFTSEAAKEMDSYVPMQTGMLKNSRQTEPGYVKYPGPYAHYMYQGKLYLAPNGSAWARKGQSKVKTDIDLTYNELPKRGPFWDKRMWFDKKDKIMRGLIKITGGKAK